MQIDWSIEYGLNRKLVYCLPFCERKGQVCDDDWWKEERNNCSDEMNAWEKERERKKEDDDVGPIEIVM